MKIGRLTWIWSSSYCSTNFSWSSIEYDQILSEDTTNWIVSIVTSMTSSCIISNSSLRNKRSWISKIESGKNLTTRKKKKNQKKNRTGAKVPLFKAVWGSPPIEAICLANSKTIALLILAALGEAGSWC